ncbi:MAG TPA: hypothetical protein VEM57_09520 [Candidatus Binatus sp.]|nr:hypothetical protein [Candidatus Binatus sp.]
MADPRARRRTAPKRTLIGPLVMLASGMAVGALMWRLLMLEPVQSPGGRAGPEQLSRHDRQALDRLLGARGPNQ